MLSPSGQFLDYATIAFSERYCQMWVRQFSVWMYHSNHSLHVPCRSGTAGAGNIFEGWTSLKQRKVLEVRVQLKCDGTRWRTGGEVKGKLAKGVGSQYSHTTSEHGVSSITTADGHTSAASSRLSWRHRRFKWTRPFRQKMKSDFCACAIQFKTVYQWEP
jgi:hypothetical protein